MLKKFLAGASVVALSAAAFAQSTTLTANTTDATAGADLAGFSRSTHFTYDLNINTDGSDWTGSELTLEVVGDGSIWHASDQTNFGDAIGVAGLAVPFLPPGTNTKNFDTFMSAPGADFFVNPSIANATIISTPTRILGTNAALDEIPLAWFDTGPNSTPFLGGRFTFLVDASQPLNLDGEGALFATITGRTTSSTNSTGVNFSFNIYQVPEPATLALVGLGGLAALIRRR